MGRAVSGTFPDAPSSAWAVETADPLIERLRELLTVAGAAGPMQDPARADTSVAIAIRLSADAVPRPWATLLLDRRPVQVAPGDSGDAEASLTFDVVDLEAFVAGELHLAMAIASGRVQATGPIRRFLRITPILRGLANPSGVTVASVPSARPLQRSDWSQAWSEADEYGYHRGGLEVPQEYPGDYWCIECRGVTKSFGPNQVLRGLDLGIPEGTISVVLGPSGTGKSVLIKHIIGLLYPDSGEVRVHGDNVQDLRLSRLLHMRRKFGILFQDGALFGSMSLYDNVAFPLRQHTSLTEREIADVTMQRLDEMGLVGAEHRMPSEISGGMRKRAGFARALVMDPEIVLFDEPDSGLDPVRTSLLCDVIKEAHAKHGGTYVLITHDIASARRIAEYVALLWRGRIVEAGPAAEVFESTNPFVRQFLAGDSAGPLNMD
ncbi:MAG: transporter [Conexibacter sp.]|nr:transporter [Conexibacter sp.]